MGKHTIKGVGTLLRILILFAVAMVAGGVLAGEGRLRGLPRLGRIDRFPDRPGR